MGATLTGIGSPRMEEIAILVCQAGGIRAQQGQRRRGGQRLLLHLAPFATPLRPME
jgi:hypothetical protein